MMVHAKKPLEMGFRLEESGWYSREPSDGIKRRTWQPSKESCVRSAGRIPLVSIRLLAVQSKTAASPIRRFSSFSRVPVELAELGVSERSSFLTGFRRPLLSGTLVTLFLPSYLRELWSVKDLLSSCITNDDSTMMQNLWEQKTQPAVAQIGSKERSGNWISMLKSC
ncbi:hypothetical protein OPV22_004093 [Ensete ventricosum]|uniref:Uncharacterized protein n=1 Tax=Ensete ventricosum TaxID=4639 RepID=A0AAV8S2U4_ENSVE|nr:hypothetical protein OPV22_004093 [Ensete ventricosum]